MIVLILILILLAILYSTEQGRELLSELFLLPFKIIAFPFTFVADVKRGYKEERAEAKELKEKEELKKSLKKEELDLIQEKFLLPSYTQKIHEQISLYRKFERGEIDKAYLQPTLSTVREDLFTIKDEKIEELRNRPAQEVLAKRELRKVVLIDKDKFVLNIYQTKLSKENIEVLTFIDYSDDALAQILKFQPDVITCEVVSNEGILDGFDILRSIRKSGEMKKGGLLARTRFAFLTNQGQSRDLKQALDMGADGYIIKANIMPDELLELLTRVNKGNRKVVVMDKTPLADKFQKEGN